MDNDQTSTPLYSWYALALLLFIYILNFLDRTIIYSLFPLIKQEMDFSDLQLALLGGTAFTIFYTVLGVPFGALADRSSRTKLIAFGVIVWSIFSGLTAFAESFTTLFLCRVMVGVGEATLGPAAISLLSDFFPPSRRATVTSIYSMGIAIGAGSSALIANLLTPFGWRMSFIVVGFPGILLGIIVYFLREPTRSVKASTSHLAPEVKWSKLLTNKVFIALCLGYALLGLATNNLSFWGAAFFTRVRGIELGMILTWAGFLTLIAGIPATLFGGVIADWFKRRSPGGRMLYGSLLSAVSVPLWLVLIFSGDHLFIVISGGLLLFAALAWLGAAAADVTEVAGVNLRGVAVAIYFFSVNIAAYLIGSNLIGFLSDNLGSATEPLMMRYALLVCPISCLLAAICLFVGSRWMSAPDKAS